MIAQLLSKQKSIVSQRSKVQKNIKELFESFISNNITKYFSFLEKNSNVTIAYPETLGKSLFFSMNVDFHKIIRKENSIIKRNSDFSKTKTFEYDRRRNRICFQN